MLDPMLGRNRPERRNQEPVKGLIDKVLNRGNWSFGGPDRDRTDDLFHAMENQQLTAQTAKEL
jgi:hypothetical protein